VRDNNLQGYLEDYNEKSYPTERGGLKYESKSEYDKREKERRTADGEAKKSQKGRKKTKLEYRKQLERIYSLGLGRAFENEQEAPDVQSSKHMERAANLVQKALSASKG